MNDFMVGVLRVRLIIRGSRSLKEKRHAIRKIKDRAISRFSVSAAEIGDLNDWKSARVGFTVISNDTKKAAAVLDQVANMIENLGVGQLTDCTKKIIHLNDDDFPLEDQFPDIR